MASFKKLVYTRKTEAGFTEELHLSFRAYMKQGKRWTVELYGIFGRSTSSCNVDINAAKVFLADFNKSTEM